MKKITVEEFDKMPIKGTGRSSPFFKAIASLRVGEALFISKEEYKQTRSPGSLCRYIMKRLNVKYDCGRLADGSGWAVKRVE